jgi:hypothetical protein
MITAKITGGLGNQLFQVFNLLAYSIKHKVEYFITDEPMNVKFIRPWYWDTFLDKLSPKLRQPYRKIMYEYKELGYTYNSIPDGINNNRPFKFCGYYQSYKYFIDYESEILSILDISSKRDVVRNNHSDLQFENTMSIHFRLGDYKKTSNLKHHPILPTDYYTKSIGEICTKIGRDNWDVLYFFEAEDRKSISRTIEILKDAYPRLNFIPVDTNIPDYDQMLMMSLCKHHIIANSTFSWWGAYLNPGMDKIITCPHTWFGNNQQDTSDLIHPTWIIIENTDTINSDRLP